MPTYMRPSSPRPCPRWTDRPVRPLVADDDYRALGVRGHFLAHRADQEAGDLTMPARPHDEEAGTDIGGRADQSAGRRALHDVGLQHQVGIITGDRLLCLLEDVPGGLEGVEAGRQR